eukprot:TRINITY_DN28129_c0_g1_i1.p1 TRINITY_DN28129_c0_g1~~TRINITY_DN28129_c0_g1_i1.p1  ORF type:complete len:581 (+),score=241.42 TRINITY_DN28129_c0_g1_i1:70-1743(+)
MPQPQKELLLVYVYLPELTTYRLDELHACAAVCGTEVEVTNENIGAEGCFVLARFESDAKAKEVISRMVLVKGVFELWGEGSTYELLVQNVQQFDPSIRSRYKGSSFKFVFEAFGAKLSFGEKVERFNKFSNVGLDGPVEMQNPDEHFWIIEDRGIPTTNKKSHNGMTNVLFARQVGIGSRKTLDTHSLKTRRYIGTTTMVPELCMLMSNLAGVQKGSIVWDPFCGTGSTLVSASHYGATCFGSDLDGRALGNKEHGIQSNCQQYGFIPMELMRLDMSQACWRADLSEVFDAIISDPPYGRRESRKRIDEQRQEKLDEFVEALSPQAKKQRIDELAERYIPPPKRDYNMKDLLTDMVDKAARLLRIGGKLVYWHPTTAQYTQDELATHPCMKLLADKGQSITIKLKRRLVVMEKTAAWTPDMKVCSPKAEDAEDDFHYDMETKDCEEYVQYRKKRDQKKAACRQFREENNIDKPPRLSRSERRQKQAEQIAKKKQRREESHAASKETSLYLTKIDRVKRGKMTVQEAFGDDVPLQAMQDLGMAPAPEAAAGADTPMS